MARASRCGLCGLGSEGQGTIDEHPGCRIDPLVLAIEEVGFAHQLNVAQLSVVNALRFLDEAGVHSSVAVDVEKGAIRHICHAYTGSSPIGAMRNDGDAGEDDNALT